MQSLGGYVSFDSLQSQSHGGLFSRSLNACVIISENLDVFLSLNTNGLHKHWQRFRAEPAIFRGRMSKTGCNNYLNGIRYVVVFDCMLWV